ncbi:hypothetical protein HanRHA438_Chr14g0671771 [Helianthus annuus]|nr:hypothetical protein HanRHA438_Chr14g0671771 [Helianthus annuus]
MCDTSFYFPLAPPNTNTIEEITKRKEILISKLIVNTLYLVLWSRAVQIARRSSLA